MEKRFLLFLVILLDALTSGRKIAYFITELNERGTSLATFDYAYYNSIHVPGFLEPVIIYGTEKEKNFDVEDRFVATFGVNNVFPKPWQEISEVLVSLNITDLYCLNPSSDMVTFHIPPSIRLLFHYSFDIRNHESQHDRCDVQAKVSPVVLGDVPIVPHIVRKPFIPINASDTNQMPDMREALGIPSHATVFCRHGGYRQFDATFVKEYIKLVAASRPDVYFIFVNTEQFSTTDRSSEEFKHIIYLEKIISIEEKSKFIRSCDAMIHARSRGETFGLAVAEFSVHNKPIIVYDRGKIGMPERHHINTLGAKGMVFKNSVMLSRYLMDFNRTWSMLQDWDVYSKVYNPEKVSEIFNNVFLKADHRDQEGTKRFLDAEL